MATVEFAPDYELATLRPRIADADLLVTSCFAAVPAELIAAGPRLRGIVKYGVGVDNIDLEAARQRGLPVANCPDYGSGTIADHAFALLLALARRLTLLDRSFRRIGWMWPDDSFLGVDLERKTLGLIGLGRIGKKMAQRAAGFDMRLLAHDPYIPPAEFSSDRYSTTSVELDELLRESDFISVHCVLTEETRCLIGRREFQLMKPSACLIDVSRGAIIDEPALLAALENHEIAGVGLDVFAEEPLSSDHPLLALDNVVATPHIAWYTAEAAAEQSRQAADAVLDLLAGRRPRSVVNGM